MGAAEGFGHGEDQGGAGGVAEGVVAVDGVGGEEDGVAVGEGVDLAVVLDLELTAQYLK